MGKNNKDNILIDRRGVSISRRVELFGCPIDALDMAQTIDKIEQTLPGRRPHQHVAVNVAKLVAMQKDPSLRQIVHACDVINADGMPIVWASRLLKKPLPSRVAGIDLFLNLLQRCAQKGYRPYFFGARPDIVEKMVRLLESRYPSLQVAGYRHGYFAPSDEAAIAQDIRDSRADMLFVGISSPVKEKFLNRWLGTMEVPFAMGVGGSFDVLAGKTKRAPLVMQKAGLEWLYRVGQEPGRMWKRYAKSNLVFLGMIIVAFTRMVSGCRQDERPNG